MYTLADFKRPEKYLEYMYGQTPGFIARGYIKENKAYKENFFLNDRLATANLYYDKKNTYCSMNTFLSARTRRNHNSGRKVNNIKRLNALYLDLDCYKIGLTQEQVVQELESKVFGSKVPYPTFVIDSGRGVYLIWKISEDRNAKSRWEVVQHYLFEQCKEFNADPKSVDAARILRVPGTINGNNGKRVNVMQFNDVHYTLHSIMKEFKIEPKPKKVKPNVFPYGQATNRQRKIAQWQSEHLGIPLPDFESYDETFEYIKNNSKSSQPETKERTVSSRRRASGFATMNEKLKGYIRDLFKLFSIRKGIDCCRELALFFCRLWTYETTGDSKLALQKTKELNKSFDVPFDDQYVETRTQSAEIKISRGDTYHYSLSSIISTLKISKYEQEQMEYLRYRTAESIEKKKNDNRKNYLESLKKNGKKTKKEFISDRRKVIAELIARGLTKKEICEACNISPRTFDSDKAAIIADGTLDTFTSLSSPENTNAEKINEKRTKKSAHGESRKKFSSSIIKSMKCSAYNYILNLNNTCYSKKNKTSFEPDPNTS